MPHLRAAADPPASTSQVEGINLEPIFEQVEAEDSEEQKRLDEYPRLVTPDMFLTPFSIFPREVVLGYETPL